MQSEHSLQNKQKLFFRDDRKKSISSIILQKRRFIFNNTHITQNDQSIPFKNKEEIKNFVKTTLSNEWFITNEQPLMLLLRSASRSNLISEIFQETDFFKKLFTFLRDEFNKSNLTTERYDYYTILISYLVEISQEDVFLQTDYLICECFSLVIINSVSPLHINLACTGLSNSLIDTSQKSNSLMASFKSHYFKLVHQKLLNLIEDISNPDNQVSQFKEVDGILFFYFVLVKLNTSSLQQLSDKSLDFLPVFKFFLNFFPKIDEEEQEHATYFIFSYLSLNFNQNVFYVYLHSGFHHTLIRIFQSNLPDLVYCAVRILFILLECDENLGNVI